MAHRERPLPPMPAFVPSQVATFITRLTAKDPEARPADASEVARWASEMRDQLTAGPAVLFSRRRIRAAYRHHTGASYPAPTQAEYAAPLGTGPSSPRRSARPIPMGAVRPASMGAVRPVRAESPLPARTRRRRGRTPATPDQLYRRAGIAAAAVAMTVLGLYLANVHTPTAPYAADALPRISGPGRSNPPHVAAAHLVEVKASSLVGQQVSVAVRKLRALGLSALVSWQPTESETPGTVISVRPTGQVAAGSRIELVAAYLPTSSKSGVRSTSGRPSGGQTHHHGHGPKKPKPKDSNQPSPRDSQSPSPSSSPSQTDGSGNGDTSGGGNGNGGQVPPEAYAVGG
jgi:hypothetical protein